MVRFLKGDLMSLIISNYCPVLEYSIPYGGWPPLHTIMQSVILLIFNSVPYSRLLVGMLSILLFGIIAISLINRIIVSADIPLVFMTAILSPAAVIYTSLGVRHVLIPLGAVTSLYLVSIYSKLTKYRLIIIFFIGIMLGLTDWNTYTIIPSLFLLIFYFSILGKSFDGKDLSSFLIFSIILSFGFLTSFIFYKALLVYEIQSTEYKILYTVDGITLKKLLLRSISSPNIILFAIGLSFIRLFWIFLPILFLLLIVKIFRAGGIKLSYSLSFDKIIFLLALLAPLLYCIIFSGHVGIGEHSYQILAFLTPATIFVSYIQLNYNNKNLIRIIYIIILIFLNILNLRGNELLPDKFLVASFGVKTEVPMEPGNYNVNEEQIKLTITDIIRVAIKQITQLPLNHKRLITFNSFNKSLNNYIIYSNAIKINTMESDILFMFDWTHFSHMYYTDRTIIGVKNYSELYKWFKYIFNKFGNGNIGIIIPNSSDKEMLTNLKYIYHKTIKLEKVKDTPYSIIKIYR